MSINKRIKSVLDEKRFSNSAFEKKNGLANGTIRKITIEENFNPSYKVIKAFAVTFPDLDIRWLVTGKGTMVGGQKKFEKVDTTLVDAMERQITDLQNSVEEETSKRKEISVRLDDMYAELKKVRERVIRIERP